MSLMMKWSAYFTFLWALGSSKGVGGDYAQLSTHSAAATDEFVKREWPPGRLHDEEEASEMIRNGDSSRIAEWGEAEKRKQQLVGEDQLDGNLTGPGSDGGSYAEGSTSPDPLCAADADPFRDCLPSDVKSLKNIARGTKQHVTVCLKFYHGLRCVTEYTERCFPPGTSAFLIPLNKTYVKNCAQLRSGQEILGSNCYAELEPKWRRCASAFQNLPRLTAEGELVVSNEMEKPGRIQVTFADDRKRCCDRFRALKCAYDAAKSVEACTPLATVQAIRATDLLSREYAPVQCLVADPSDCYFPMDRGQSSTQAQGRTNSSSKALTSSLSAAAVSSGSRLRALLHSRWLAQYSANLLLSSPAWEQVLFFVILGRIAYWPLAFSASGGVG